METRRAGFLWISLVISGGIGACGEGRGPDAGPAWSTGDGAPSDAEDGSAADTEADRPEGSSGVDESAGDGADESGVADATDGAATEDDDGSGGADGPGSGGSGGPTGLYDYAPTGAHVYAPATIHDGGPAAVVFGFHGAGDTGSNFMAVLLGGGSWQQLADDEGILIVTFDGTTAGSAWTYPVAIPGWNVPTGPQDVDRLEETLEVLREGYDVDARRIYTVGFSMGATMATLAALELDAEVAAFVAVAQGTPAQSYADLAPASGYAVPGLLQGDPGDPVYASIPYTADLLQSNGHEIEVREFPGTGHVGSWMASTVQDPGPSDVWSWLSAHARP